MRLYCHLNTDPSCISNSSHFNRWNKTLDLGLHLCFVTGALGVVENRLAASSCYGLQQDCFSLWLTKEESIVPRAMVKHNEICSAWHMDVLFTLTWICWAQIIGRSIGFYQISHTYKRLSRSPATDTPLPLFPLFRPRGTAFSGKDK